MSGPRCERDSCARKASSAFDSPNLMGATRCIRSLYSATLDELDGSGGQLKAARRPLCVRSCLPPSERLPSRAATDCAPVHPEAPLLRLTDGFSLIVLFDFVSARASCGHLKFAQSESVR